MRRSRLLLNCLKDCLFRIGAISLCTLSFLFSSCGYRFSAECCSEKKISLSIPYVVGDLTGELTQALIQAVSASSRFVYSPHDGDYILRVEMVGQGEEKVGYRYDREGDKGKRKSNIVPTEDRLSIAVHATLVDESSDEVVAGPFSATAFTDFDYVDTNSIKDLSLPQTGAVRQTSISFSLGQLDSIEGSHGNAAELLYRSLAQKVVSGLYLSFSKSNKAELEHDE